MNSKDTERLIRRLLAHEAAAFEELFVLFQHDLHRLAMHYVMDHELANDIVQETFIGIYEQPRLKGITNLSGYLRTAVRNRSLNYLRSIQIEDRNRLLYFEELATLPLADDEETKELMGRLLQQMNELPEACRNICQLRFVEGLLIKDIAQRLGIAESTVKTQIQRGLSKLKK